MYIYENPELSVMTGFSALTTISYLDITSNPLLNNLDFMGGVTSITAGLSINNNDALTSLSNLNSGLTIDGSLYIVGNASLSTCGVTSICNYIENPTGSFDISANATGCANYAEVQAVCSPVPYCTELTSPIAGATNVPPTTSLSWGASANSTGYKLTIGTTPNGNNILDNFDVGSSTVFIPPSNFPFSSTIYVTIVPYNINGDAVACLNESFQTAAQCPAGNVILLSQNEVDAFSYTYPLCSSISGGFQIGPLFPNNGYSNISNLTGLSGLTQVAGLLDIRWNAQLSNLEGLNNIQSAGILRIASNTSTLNNIAALSSLTTAGSVHITNNNGLTNLFGLNGISSLNTLQILRNQGLINLNGLEGIQSAVYVEIQENNSLSNLQGLNTMNQINTLSVVSNSILNSLDALTNLNAVSNLYIQLNPSLSSLDGLQNINPALLANLFLTSNLSLSICEIQPICDYLSIPANSANIQSNATGCATRAEVEAACALVLPISLLSLQAQPQKTNTHLTWRTAAESQNAYFEIEHSRNGVSFQTIGTVPGQGTTTVPHDYDFTHEHPGPGIHYYRLRQVDFDGTSSYSQVVSIDFPSLEDLESLALWPNPTTGIVNLGWESQEAPEYVVTDALGRVLQSGSLVAGQIDLSAFPKGVYFLNLKTENGMRAERVVKQ